MHYGREQEIARAVAKLVVFGFNGKKLDSHARALIRSGAGGVILFSRNIDTPEQVARLCGDLKKEAGNNPLIIMVDQEGGVVSRLGPPFTPIPPARVIGSTQDPQAAASVGRILGRELRAVNIDMDLAPVLDVDTNPKNPVIGNRSFGRSPTMVADFGYEFIRSLQKEGVAACAKHFPGHGDTHLDSHLELPSVKHDMKRLQNVELVPFAKAVKADVAAIMVAHINVPMFQTEADLEKSGICPAMMCKGVTDHLRKKLLFEGVIISDSLEMGAISKNFSLEDASVRAVLAGVDMLLVPHTKEHQQSVIRGLAKAVMDGKLPLERVQEAGNRVSRLMQTYVQPQLQRDRSSRLESVGCKEHMDAVDNILHQAAAMST